MAEATKKAKAPAKAKKEIAEKPVVKEVKAKEVAPTKPATKKSAAKTEKASTGIAAVKPVSQEEVAALAHSYWAARGYKHGQHVDDWFRAEQELRNKAS